MARNTMSGADAKRYVLVGRTAAVALGVTAAALWALDVPGMSQLPPKPEPAPVAEGATRQAAQETPRLDSSAIADLTERLDMAVVKAPPVEEVKNEPKIEDDPPSGPEWAYLGPIFESTRTLAVVSVDGHQQVLAEGRQFGDTTLVSVEPERITVSGPGGKRQVERNKRGGAGANVAWLRNMPGNAPPPAAQNAAGANGMSPEVMARLRERGIDPQQASQFRQQMRDRRNRGRPDGGNGGNGGNGPNAAIRMNLPPGAVANDGNMTTRTIIQQNGESATIAVPMSADSTETDAAAGQRGRRIAN